MGFKPENEFIYGGNLHLNYRVLGEGKRKIIFLHGFAASSRTWDDIIPLLTLNNSQFILFDLIGAGFSSKPKDGDYSILANASAIAKYIKENNVDDFVFVGHSFGGGVALLATIELKKYGINPKALILLDAAAYKIELPFFVENLRVPIISNVLLSLTSADYQARYTLKKIYFDKNKVTQEKVNRYSYFLSLDGHKNAMIQTAKQIIPRNFERFTNEYASLNAPALVLWGRHDPAISVSNGEKLSTELPNATLSIIEESGHNPHEERPELTAKEINTFLNKLNDN